MTRIRKVLKFDTFEGLNAGMTLRELREVVDGYELKFGPDAVVSDNSYECDGNVILSFAISEEREETEAEAEKRRADDLRYAESNVTNARRRLATAEAELAKLKK